ncbi:hypothetical protein ACFFKH_26295, partial [Micromonospora marina]
TDHPHLPGPATAKINLGYVALAEGRDTAQLDAEFDPELTEATVAYHTVEELSSKARLLERRTRRLNPKAPVWRRLTIELLGFNVHLYEVDPRRWRDEPDLDSDTYSAGFERVKAHRKKALEVVTGIADAMKPPRTYPIRSLIKQQTARLRKRWRPTPSGDRAG